jgi:hypothetical protein
MFHLVSFTYGSWAVKKGYPQLLMRSGILGLVLVMLAVVLLQERSVEYLYWIAAIFGLSNGQYWMVNHLDSFDQTSSKQRASFFSYRVSFVTIAKLAIPFTAWVAFVFFGNDDAYQFIFVVSIVAAALAFLLTSIERRQETKWDIIGTLKILKKTPGFASLGFSTFLYGATVRSALIELLLPLFIFELLSGEAGLSSVEIWIQIGLTVVTLIFARYKKNTDHIKKIIYLSGGLMALGAASLFINLSPLTYGIFIVTFIISNITSRISISTFSNNFINTIKGYNAHRIEYLVVREYFAIFGFLVGYVFLYFFSSMTVDSIRPLLAGVIIGSLASIPLGAHVWRIVSKNLDDNGWDQ